MKPLSRPVWRQVLISCTVLCFVGVVWSTDSYHYRASLEASGWEKNIVIDFVVMHKSMKCNLWDEWSNFEGSISVLLLNAMQSFLFPDVNTQHIT